MAQCNHKYEVVQPDGYQYCRKCGEARLIPCFHKWEMFDQVDKIGQIDGQVHGRVYIQKCAKCGVLMKTTVGSDQT
jgi:hypothetical protein